MNKAAAVAVAAVVGVGAATTGAFAFTGRGAVNALKAQSAQLAKLSPAFQVADEKVEQGLFHSTYQVKLRFGCMPALPQVPGAPPLPTKPGDPLELSIRTEVRHGPILPSGFGAAQLDTVLLVPEAWKARTEALTNKQPPLRAVSAIKFDHSFDSTITVPPLKFNDPQAGSFETESLRIKLHGTSSDPALGGSYALEIPGWSMHTRAPDASLDVSVGKAVSHYKLSARKDPTLWFVDTESTGSIADVTLTASANSAPGATPTTFKMGFPALKFDAHSKLDKGLYASEVAYSGGGTFNDFKIDKIELKAGFRRLDAAGYQKLLEHLISSALSCDPKQREGGLEAQFPALEREAVALMMHDPEYGLDQLAVELDGKRGELSYSIGTRGVTPADGQRALLDLALAHGVIRAHAKVQLGLLDAIDKRLAPNAQQGTLRTLADFALTQFGPAGYLVQTGDALESTLEYANGQLQLNGKTPALPDLGSMFGP